ncbi:general secretion pathway protein F [Syntrophus gentianae]|uniref:General secretion pathway protein F n=1 Tax=Syntrophus gentianae TaxID=43775 RepID=A0A1H8ASV9_9BACT|nr:type II secretion system F family protein [Syntrophus gentianae]SEM73643.1 general secretion pathway protein F [Syntrophus gentianae]
MEFAYTYLDSTGQENRGSLMAGNRAEALAKLRARGLTVTNLVEKASKEQRRFVLRKKIKSQDIYSISRELSTLLRSGIRIDRALELLRNGAKKQEMKELLTAVLQEIKAGGNVAHAFEKTDSFSPFLVSMIQVNEAAGNLQSAFENIAQYLKFQISFRAEIRNAMTYPIFLIFACILTFLAIFQFVVPRFFSIFGSNLETLPLPARVLYTLSGWINFKSLGIVLGLAGIVLLVRRLYPTRIKLPNLSARLILLPGVRTLIINLELSRFCYSMHSMLLSGVEFLRALRLSISLIQNVSFRNAMMPLVGRVKEGRKISDVFAEVPFLPDIVPNMVRVGEESSSLKEVFLELYAMFDERFKNSVKRLLTLVEPVIIIVMGLVVGFIVITLILTVMSVSSIKL